MCRKYCIVYLVCLKKNKYIQGKSADSQECSSHEQRIVSCLNKRSFQQYLSCTETVQSHFHSSKPHFLLHTADTPTSFNSVFIHIHTWYVDMFSVEYIYIYTYTYILWYVLKHTIHTYISITHQASCASSICIYICYNIHIHIYMHVYKLKHKHTPHKCIKYVVYLSTNILYRQT